MSNLDFSLRFRALKFVSDISSNFRLIRAIWTALCNLVRFFQFRFVPLDFRRVLSVFERLPPIAVPPYFGLKAASAHGKFRPTSDCCTWIRTFLLDFEYFHTISYSSIQFSNILSNLAHFRLILDASV